jgi:PPE-repeat protein
MSFLVLPPDINSALMYSGAGSGPMLAAAAAWDGLATELGSAAQSFSSITSSLAGDAWQGAASAAMLQTATQYSGVLSAAANQAQTAAAQAQAVASEFEAALAATVHPALVSANRNELVQLVFSNLFGQNAPAIAAAESDYEAMWARDVAAMVGYHGGVSAAAGQLSSWTTALPNLAKVPAAIAGGSLNPAAGGPLGLLGGGTFGGLGNGPLSNLPGPTAGVARTVLRLPVDVINAPGSLLFGQELIPLGPQPTGGTATINGGVATTPLTVRGGTEPVVDASVGPGSAVPLLVDTGSTGLIIPFTKVGGLLGLLELGVPTGGGIGGFSGGLNYVYATYNAPVNFGGGLVTSPTPVQVELFAFPTSIQSALNNGLTFQSFFASDGVSGVLGVGPNAGGPGHVVPLTALPSPYNQGLLINEDSAHPYLQFGGPPSNLGAPLTVLNGSPVTNLNVQVGNTNHLGVPSIVDSGGVQGSLPTSLGGTTGTPIIVRAPDGTVLYQYNLNQNYSPTPITSGLMNTGNLIFQQHPIYINYGGNTSTVYPT